MLAGFDEDGTPQLWQTEPSGNYSAWQVGATYTRSSYSEGLCSKTNFAHTSQASATGRNAKNTLEFLEKNYPKDGENYAPLAKVCDLW